MDNYAFFIMKIHASICKNIKILPDEKGTDSHKWNRVTKKDIKKEIYTFNGMNWSDAM